MRTFYLMFSLLLMTALWSPSASGQWTSIGPSEVIHHMRTVSFIDEMTGWAAGWISISSGTGGVQSIVARTSDGGETWNVKTVNKVEINAMHFVDANNGFAVGSGYDCGCAVLLRSVDGGRNWETQEYPNLVGGFQAIDFFDAQYGIMGGGNPETGNGYIMRTTDGGESFIKIFDQEGAHISRLDQVSRTLAYAAGGAEAAGENVIYKTINLDAGVGTIAWQAVKTFDGFYSISGLDFVGEDVGYAVMTVFDAGDFRGEIYKTTDGGVEWKNAFATSAYTLVALDFHDADNGLAVGENGAIVQTNDGGAAWSDQITHETQLLTWVQFVTPGIAYAVGTDGTIMKYDRSSAVPGNDASGKEAVRVEIAPNPSVSLSGILVRGGMEGEDYRLVLTDARGEEVGRIELPDGRGEFHADELPGGSYFYRLMRDGGTVTTGRLIVQ